MGKVVTGLTMSLDGFIAGPNDSVENSLGDGGERLFNWYFKGDTEFKAPGNDMVFKVPAASVNMLRESFGSVGALITGRRTFDIANAWGGKHPLGTPVVVMTHHIPTEWANDGKPFTFVTDGIESAVEKAQAIAGDKVVAVDAANVVQQCLNAGLLDEINVDLVPFLIGGGVRLFDHLKVAPVDLECTRVVVSQGVTHLQYRVIK
jgi:dihydrofolate reductase